MSDEGGGIRNANSGFAVIARSTISGNQTFAGMGNNGGGISNNSLMALTNVTISGNSTGGTGGGVRNSAGSSLQLFNTTISGNTATANGGGIRNLGSLDATNSIVAGNTGDDLNNNQGGTLGINTNNLISTMMTPINPLLAPLGNYGGPTQTRPPLPGSPALDAGDNAACADNSSPFAPNNLDQRSVTRPVNTTCDIGAVEMRGFTFTAIGGTPQSTTAGTSFVAPLEVTLSETGGSPLPGASVAFVAPVAMQSATLTTSPAITDTNGKASVTATANLVAGMYSVTASAGGGTSATFALTNTPPSIIVTPTTLPTGVVGGVYPAQMLTAMGGSAPYTFALVPVMGQQLPPGLTLTGNTLGGTPTMAGMFTFTVRATDANMFIGDKQYTVTVNPAVSVAPVSLSGGTVGTAYTQTVSATGGTGTGYAFTVTSGTLPAGLILNATTGAITGTPTMAGMFTVTITATDNGTNTGSKAYTVTILPAVAVAPLTLPNGTVGVAYTQSVSATGGTGSGYTFALVPMMGTLPPGLMLSSATGTLTGTPTTAGMFTFTLRATDSGMNTGSKTYTVTVGAAAVTSVTITRTSGGTVTGGVTNVMTGGTVQLGLTATLTDGSMQSVPGGAMWTSNDPNKATVDSTGNVTALSPGSVTITATYMGQTTMFTLVVTAPGTGGLVPNPIPVVRPDAATVQAAPQLVPPTRAAAPGASGGGIGPQGAGNTTPTPRPAPPQR